MSTLTEIIDSMAVLHALLHSVVQLHVVVMSEEANKNVGICSLLADDILLNWHGTLTHLHTQTHTHTVLHCSFKQSEEGHISSPGVKLALLVYVESNENGHSRRRRGS